MSIGKNLADFLLKYRESHGLTQGDLAEAIGVVRITVHRWETAGADAVTLTQLEKISKVTHASVATLLGLQVENERGDQDLLKAFSLAPADVQNGIRMLLMGSAVSREQRSKVSKRVEQSAEGKKKR